MAQLFTTLRLPLLALLTSFTLTSCFDSDKRDDPRPHGNCPSHKTPAPPPAPGGNS